MECLNLHFYESVFVALKLANCTETIFKLCFFLRLTEGYFVHFIFCSPQVLFCILPFWFGTLDMLYEFRFKLFFNKKNISAYLLHTMIYQKPFSTIKIILENEKNSLYVICKEKLRERKRRAKVAFTLELMNGEIFFNL